MLQRQIHITAPGKQIDVFGAGWGITLAQPFTTPIVAAIVKGQPVPLTGERIACFFPPLSIVEWALQPGVYEFTGVFCQVPLPKGLPITPIAFATPYCSLPQNVEGLLDLVRQASHPVAIMKEDMISAAARRMKRVIEQSFLEPVSIAELATQIGFNHATIIRAFSKAYGMTPIRYRSKLRVYASIRDIATGSQISHAAGKSGYHDLSQYNRQFKREMSHPPSLVMPVD